jgi:CheY-like chemotaxis protein
MMDRSLPPVGPDGRTPLRLLFVEDSRDDAELLERMLAQGGYRVEAHRVQDEPALRAALATGPFDVVLGDHSLPALSSLRALALVHERDPDTPFLVVSGTIREEDAVALMKAGASDYLLKDRLGRLVPAVRREMLEARNRRAHRAARAEIERSEAQYRSLIDNAVVGVFHADASGRFTFVNQALVGMLGYPTAAALRDVEPATAVFEEAGVLAGLLGRGPRAHLGPRGRVAHRDGRPFLSGCRDAWSSARAARAASR